MTASEADVTIRILIPKPAKGPHSAVLGKFLLLAATVALIGSAYVTVADGGVFAVARARAQSDQLHSRVLEMERANRARRDQIRALRTDPDAIERLARERLDMARPGETLYLLPPKPGDAGDPFDRIGEREGPTPTAPSSPYRRH